MFFITLVSSFLRVLFTPYKKVSSSLLGQGMAFSQIMSAILWLSFLISEQLRAKYAPAISPFSFKRVPIPVTLSYSPKVDNYSKLSITYSLSLPFLVMWVVTSTFPQMKKRTQSNLSPQDFSIVPFQKERRTIESANCIFYNFFRSWKYSLTSIKCRHFLISSRLLKIFKIADSFIRIIFDSSKATTVSLRPQRPKRISVCPKMRRMPSFLVTPYSDEHEKLPSRTTQMNLSRPSQAYLAQMDVPGWTMTASCAMQRLMKCSELVSKNLLKKGRRESDLAISMPQNGILSCYYLESTLNICCSSPFTYRLNSSIIFYNTTKSNNINRTIFLLPKKPSL